MAFFSQIVTLSEERFLRKERAVERYYFFFFFLSMNL